MAHALDARTRSLEDPSVRRSVRRRRRRAIGLLAAAIISIPTIVLPIVLVGAACLRLYRLRRVREILDRYSWRSVDVNGGSIDVVERDRSTWRDGGWRVPDRFIGEVAGPVRPAAGRRPFSVVRASGSDELHLVRGIVGTIQGRDAPAIEDLSAPEGLEQVPIVASVLTSDGLHACAPTEWVPVLIHDGVIWPSHGEAIGRVVRDLDGYALLDGSGTRVLTRQRCFYIELFRHEDEQVGSYRNRVLDLDGQQLHSSTGVCGCRLRTSAGLLLAATTNRPRFWSNQRTVVVWISTSLASLDRATALLHIALSVRAVPRDPTTT